MDDLTASLAAGGFARGELFPYSNPELVIIREGDPAPYFNDAVAEFVRLLWAKGVRPGLRVCTMAECLAVPDENVNLSIKLLDRRTLAGDSSEGLAAGRFKLCPFYKGFPPVFGGAPSASSTCLS